MLIVGLSDRNGLSVADFRPNYAGVNVAASFLREPLAQEKFFDYNKLIYVSEKGVSAMSAIGAVGGYGSIGGYYSIYQNKNLFQNRNANPSGTEPVSPVSRAMTTPIPPVNGVSAVHRGASQAVPEAEERQSQPPTPREGADPAEMAVRARIQYVNGEAEEPLSEEQINEQTKSPREVVEESECQTCKNRKYQDGSDDPGVSFKTATNVAPEQAAAAVRGHEQEHVVREQAKAQREDRHVVSQSVTIHTEICPECGDAYVSGGTTRTVTKANPVEEPQQVENAKKSGFEAIA